MPSIAPIDVTDEQLAHVRYDANGLVPAVVQDHATRQVLMMAWMNEETLRLTLTEGRTVFWSRSRQEVWRKGETSGDVQIVRGAYYDCDGDTLLLVVDQQGAGACHTGERSCFFRSFGRSPDPAQILVRPDPVGAGAAGAGGGAGADDPDTLPPYI